MVSGPCGLPQVTVMNMDENILMKTLFILARLVFVYTFLAISRFCKPQAKNVPAV